LKRGIIKNKEKRPKLCENLSEKKAGNTVTCQLLLAFGGV